jgi:prepilin-type N-terminal cleavage/methylation domain-containing protein
MSRVLVQFNRLPRRGFTLIELLIVIVIVGVLLGVAIPSVGRSINRDRVSRSAVVVHSMLDEAGQLAARLRRPVEVEFVAATRSIRLVDRDSGTVLRARSFADNQDLRATIAMTPSTGIEIFPNGRATAALTITLSGGGASSTVTRTATGIVRRN